MKTCGMTKVSTPKQIARITLINTSLGNADKQNFSRAFKHTTYTRNLQVRDKVDCLLSSTSHKALSQKHLRIPWNTF